MKPLTIDALRALARAQGLELSEAELAGLLPAVQAGRQMLSALDAVPLGDVEPTVQYRVL
jgi:Asp-tRNA(Asn)/Glu-tRNA(Gln) amidotransferase C subunit